MSRTKEDVGQKPIGIKIIIILCILTGIIFMVNSFQIYPGPQNDPIRYFNLSLAFGPLIASYGLFTKKYWAWWLTLIILILATIYHIYSLPAYINHMPGREYFILIPIISLIIAIGGIIFLQAKSIKRGYFER